MAIWESMHSLLLREIFVFTIGASSIMVALNISASILGSGVPILS